MDRALTLDGPGRSPVPSRRSPAWELTRHVSLGFGFGVLVLHPVSMVIFRWLGSAPHGDTHTAPSLLQPVLHAFHPSMLPMTLAFGLLSAAVAALVSLQRKTIVTQRDDLSRQLGLIERYRDEAEDRARLLVAQNRQLACLERSQRRTTQFMVHDFKTYLGSIVGFTELLLSGPPAPGPTRAALTRIHRQALKMLSDVTNLLDLARVQATGAVRRQTLGAARLVRDALDDPFVSALTARPVLEGDPSRCPAVMGDPALIGRVLVNLIVNAVTHNGPSTTVTLAAEPAASDTEVIFTCRDDGRGIARERLTAVFADFEGDPTGNGWGLGLAFCKATVEAHGGRIWCESTEGQGTRFRFTVPCAKEARHEP